MPEFALTEIAVLLSSDLANNAAFTLVVRVASSSVVAALDAVPEVPESALAVVVGGELAAVPEGGGLAG